MSETIIKVVDRLKAYPAMKRRLDQLCFELDNIPVVNESDFIESLALGVRPEGQGYRHGGHPSDKTMAIALQYKNIKRECEDEAYWEIKRELRSLESEVRRIEYYVSLLDKQQSDVIRLLYFERKTWEDAEIEMQISRRTLFKHRKNALNELVSMFSVLCSVQISFAKTT